MFLIIQQPNNNKDYIKNYENIVVYSEFMEKADKKLEEFLKNRILNSYKAQTMDGIGQHVIKQLFKAYLINPQQLPDKTVTVLFKKLSEDKKEFKEFNVGELRNKLSEYHFKEIDENEYKKYKKELLRTICDYIAGMTDKYAIEQHRKLYDIK